MTTEPGRPGCGEPATRIVFRGRVARLYLCDACPYAGSGKVAPYEVGELPADPADRKVGVFTGPARTCGEASA